jgi:hypothetical protein
MAELNRPGLLGFDLIEKSTMADFRRCPSHSSCAVDKYPPDVQDASSRSVAAGQDNSTRALVSLLSNSSRRKIPDRQQEEHSYLLGFTGYTARLHR